MKQNQSFGTGYRMIRDLTLTNFRGIRHAQLTDARRINVLVGMNGTGKTSFLEGVFFAAGGNPELLVRTRNWRGSGMENIMTNATTPAIVQALWAYTFRDPNAGPAKFQITDSNGKSRTIEIIQDAIESSINVSVLTTFPQQTGIVFKYTDANGEPVEIRPEFKDGQVKTGTISQFVSCHFLAARSVLPETETAVAYSNLRVNNRDTDFIDAFLSEFTSLSGLDIEAPWGNTALFATMKNGRKLPLSMISGGINHLAGILVRIAANPGSVVIIDEIENGFYHSRFESIWRTIFDLARKSDVQIFASTHNLECLQALGNALKSESHEISFMRTSLDDDQEIQIEQLPGEVLFDALEIGDVR